MYIEAVELSKWPEKDTPERRSSPFRATWFKTKELLTYELAQVVAEDVELKTMHDHTQRRSDGWPRADRAPRHPGVILTFTRFEWDETEQASKAVALRFPCDTFTLWEDNVRAIALALEALRKIDRYGVQTGSQYAGFKALPPADLGTNGMTPEQAARFIIDNCGLVIPAQPSELIASTDYAELLYKLAAKQLHPDKEGGDTEKFQKLEASMRLLREIQKQT